MHFAVEEKENKPETEQERETETETETDTESEQNAAPKANAQECETNSTTSKIHDLQLRLQCTVKNIIIIILLITFWKVKYFEDFGNAFFLRT